MLASNLQKNPPASASRTLGLKACATILLLCVGDIFRILFNGSFVKYNYPPEVLSNSYPAGLEPSSLARADHSPEVFLFYFSSQPLVLKHLGSLSVGPVSCFQLCSTAASSCAVLTPRSQPPQLFFLTLHYIRETLTHYLRDNSNGTSPQKKNRPAV